MAKCKHGEYSIFCPQCDRDSLREYGIDPDNHNTGIKPMTEKEQAIFNLSKLYRAWLESDNHAKFETDKSIIFRIDDAVLTAGDLKTLITDCRLCRYKSTDSELSPCVVCNMGNNDSRFKNQFVLDMAK